jgi:5S rRNA maturation endonuclease (ribonuclease M5)
VTATPLGRLVDALTAAGCDPRPSGGGFEARCPAHEDRRPSLSLSEGAEGQALVHCQAGCGVADVLAAVGLTLADLFPPKDTTPPRKATAEAVYDYTDEAGVLLFQVLRYRPKRFRQRRPEGTGWAWNLRGVRRVVYRLPQVLEAVAGGRAVFVTEGEKDAEALVAAGECATTNPGGAGKWRPEYAHTLAKAAEVVVVADTDEPGRAHARAVAESLPAACHVVIVEAAVGKDAAEHLGAGRGVDEFTVVYDSASGAGTGLDTAEVLKAVCAVLRRFVVWGSDEQVHFVALWVLHTYTFGLFDTTPYLDVSSAAKRSGKTRLLEILGLLVARPWSVVEASEAVLFRKVDRDRPTLLVDEVDATFGKDSKVTEGLRAIYNAGYRQGATVPRCVGTTHEPTDFAVYCPKAFAGLAGLPDTVRDRSGRIELRRRARHEPKPERLRLSKARAELEPLAADLRRWATSATDALGALDDVALPESLSDRAQDGCEVLAAIAELAGGDWPEAARAAFVAVMGDEDEADHGVLLLTHIRDAFDADAARRNAEPGDRDRLTTVALLWTLVERGDDSPWAGWWGKDLDDDSRKPAMRLAQMLRPYGVRPHEMRVAGSNVRGFERSDFVDAWDRYAPR